MHVDLCGLRMLRVKSPIYESSWEVDQNKLFSVTLHHQTKRL